MPEDADAVVAALRLGWYMAEVRGRNRPGGPPGQELSRVGQSSHSLPLSFERSPTELRIQAQAVLGA
jgi:hypothetical protein